jgi:hypothetical protein
MNNGIGPAWFNPKIRQVLTCIGSYFFSEASWDKHDEGYAAKNPERHVCDRKFLQAMLRDTSRPNNSFKVILTVFIALFFWVMVRLFGWISYYFGSKPE